LSQRVPRDGAIRRKSARGDRKSVDSSGLSATGGRY
jgi:hypothetical protein